MPGLSPQGPQRHSCRSHLSSSEKRSLRPASGPKWCTAPQQVLGTFVQEILTGIRPAEPLPSVPTGAAIEEPLVALGPALATDIEAGTLPADALSNPALAAHTAGLVAQHIIEKEPSGAFTSYQVVHPGHPSRLAVRLSPTATAAGLASASKLVRAGSLVVPLGMGSTQLQAPVTAIPVLAEPFNIKLAFHRFPGALAYKGVTSAVLRAAGYDPTEDSADTSRPLVVSEFLGDRLGEGGSRLAQLPDSSILIAFVRGPDNDPDLSQLPPAFWFSETTTTVSVTPLGAAPVPPTRSAPEPRLQGGGATMAEAGVDPMEVTCDPEPAREAPGVLAAALASVQARLEAQQAQLEAQHQLLQGLTELLRTHWAPPAPAPGDLGRGPDVVGVAPPRAPITPEPSPTGATESGSPAGPSPTPAPMAALPCRTTQPPLQVAPPTSASRRADLAASWRRSQP